MRAGRPRRWHQRCFVWVVFGIATTCVWRVIDIQGQFVPATVQTKEEGASSYIPNASSVRRIGNKLWSSSPLSIRKWGCNRSETPFIFLHLGKAGGGSVRARIANLAQRNSWNDPRVYYVPVKRHNETVLAVHCHSGYSNFEPRGLKISSYERTLPCNAATPIGQALACPDIGSTNEACPSDPTKQETAHVVYSGHNHLGVELHWLPVSFLEDWWQTHWGYPPSDLIQERWKTLDGTRPWCGNRPRPTNLTQKWEGVLFLACARRMLKEIDEQAIQALSHHRNMASKLDRARAFSDVYSSLPVLRVTVLREPFSWILSKFFWSDLEALYKCDDIQTATYGSLDPNVFLGASDSTNKRLGNIGGSGWLRRISLGYILALCGYDCVARLEGRRLADLDEIATQAEYNLRNGIAVVGLLHELDSFYEMVTARVQYMDLASPMAKQDPKDFHQSGGGDEKQRCTRVYQDPQFQAQLKTACPEFAALVRLYEVGVEVNRFQKEELQQCATEDRF